MNEETVYVQIPVCLSEAKMTATTINVVNSFNTIFQSYLLFFKKAVLKTEGRITRKIVYEIFVISKSQDVLSDFWDFWETWGFFDEFLRD